MLERRRSQLTVDSQREKRKKKFHVCRFRCAWMNGDERKRNTTKNQQRKQQKVRRFGDTTKKPRKNRKDEGKRKKRQKIFWAFEFFEILITLTELLH
jgi:hypothetical protein